MTAFTTDLPRNSSRTSTQAVIVPSTPFRSVTATDVASVILSAETASGAEIASQKLWPPSLVALNTSAAMGSKTMTAKKVVTKPRDRAVAALSLETRARGSFRGGGSTATSASAAADRALEARHDAVLRIEEALLHLSPAAEAELVDGELARADRAPLAVLLEHALQDGPVAVVREDLLRLGRAQEAEERVGRILRVARLRHRDRVLDQDRLLRDDELEVQALRSGEERLVLVREHDVALAAVERVERGAGARVLDRDVPPQLQEVRLRLLVGL